MKYRLFFKVYMALIGSLVLFAILMGLIWKTLGDDRNTHPRAQIYEEMINLIVPKIDAPLKDIQFSLDHWQSISKFGLALYGKDGKLIAQAGYENASQTLPSARFYSQYSRFKLDDGRVLRFIPPPHELTIWRYSWLVALIALTLAISIVAYPLCVRLTCRLERLEKGVAGYGLGDLSQRVKVEGRDEIAKLAKTFNQTAARLEALILSQKSLLANASHELRSPLTRLKFANESLSAFAPQQMRDELNLNIKELDQLIEEILLSSRLDASLATANQGEIVDLTALLAEECNRYRVVLDVQQAITIKGNERYLSRLIRNLLENAKRYSHDKLINVNLKQVGDSIELCVCDLGNGVPESERERIFEPFYRLKGQSENDGGVGLGLALCKQIAHYHQAEISCSPRLGGGSVFKVIFKQS